MRSALAACAAVLSLAWLWFLARGRAPGEVKRIALRITLLALAGGLVFAGQKRGIFERASLGFSLVLLAAIVAMELGYLYLLRFCRSCGRLVRELRIPACPRCGAPLPRHGMTRELLRPADERPRGPRARGAR